MTKKKRKLLKEMYNTFALNAGHNAAIEEIYAEDRDIRKY